MAVREGRPAEANPLSLETLSMLSLPERIRRSARLSGRFVLRSGEVSDTYFDKYQFEADPQLLRDIAIALSHLLPEGTEVLAGS
jgi:orotate phosphoribosyltransferase